MRALLRAGVFGLALAFLMVPFAISLAQESSSPAQPPAEVDMQWAVKIPLRDGVLLNATIFHPHDQKDALPAVFTLTPYIGDSYTDRAMYFARHGYVYALVDVRGRGNSAGVFEPFANDPKDGYDIVEWLAQQSWCNGKIAMWGGSYAGFDQWATAKEFPPHLSTIVPAAAAHPGVDFPFGFNIFSTYEMQWLTFTSGVTGNLALFSDSSFWRSKAGQYYDRHLAFDHYDELVGNPSPNFQTWMKHPTPDSYYDAMVPAPEDYKRMSIPILTITGDYDGDQAGAFTYYKRHMRYGTPEDKEKHYLIIGPWDHAGTRTPKRDVGGLKFGEASVLDLNKLHTDWYDWTMKDAKKPDFLKKRVAYYVVAADVWKYADTLESISNATKTFYLESRGEAGELFRSGMLSESESSGASADKWTYDPLNTKPGDAEPADDPNYITSQRSLVNLFGEGAIYHSEPLAESAEISGFPKLTAWLTMDVPDTDLEADIYEMLPDGGTVSLTSAAMRARYRESLREAHAIPIGKPAKYVFDDFTFFSRQVAKGSRIVLIVRSINSTGAEKNYNSGGVVASETAKDARTAHIALDHDAEHPSALELPIVKP